MARTPNGFTVYPPRDDDLVTFTYKQVPIKTWRPAAPAFQWLITFLDAVEPITEKGWDGGYAYRNVAGTNVWSEHAAGVAIDWNASQHGRGGEPYLGWSATQVRCIHWMLRKTLRGSYFRWGADWRTPDPMHFELTSKSKWDAPGNPWTRVTS